MTLSGFPKNHASWKKMFSYTHTLIIYLLHMPVSKKSSNAKTVKKSNNHTQSLAPTTLKPHQRNITTYLSKYCPNQTGIILFHYMGTGKSFSSMSIVVNWGKPIVLLAPQMLLSQWKNDYMDTFASTRPKLTAMESYESIWKLLDKHDVTTKDGRAWYAKHTLLMDECHNIAQWMNEHIDVKKRSKYMKSLMAFGHRVLLTGTPMYWGPRDLAFQVNIASGKAVMPVDESAFERQFFLTYPIKSAVYGWVKPLHHSLQLMIAWIGSVARRVDKYSYQAGMASAYLALSTSPHEKGYFKDLTQDIIALIRPLQKTQQALLRFAEGSYFYLADVPVSFLTKQIASSLVKEYDKITHAVSKFQNVKIDDKLNLNAFEAFCTNVPVNESDYFVFINQFIENIHSSFNTNNDDTYISIPHRPPKDAPDTVVTDYHRQCIIAIIHKNPQNKKKYMDLINTLEKEARKNFKSHNTAVAFIKFRDTFYKDGGKEHIDFFAGNFVSVIKRNFLETITMVQYLFIIVSIQLSLWLWVKMYSDRDALKYLNTKLFEKTVSPFISYYKPNVIQQKREYVWLNWLRWSKCHQKQKQKQTRKKSDVNSRTFPTVVNSEVKVPYTTHQTEIFIQFTMGKMDYMNYAALKIIDSPTDNPELSSFDQTSKEQYEVFGSYIGNICRFRNAKLNKVHPYDSRHLKYDQKKYIWTLHPHSSFEEVTPKFVEVVNNVRKHPGRHCIYSNYEFTSQSLCAYLVSQFGADNVRFVKNDATSTVHKQILEEWYYKDSKKTKLLLLDTRYTEGLSVLMTDAMHILDPCQSLAKEDQLKARVARLNSHKPGDTLHMYEYMCYCPLFKKTCISLKKWLQLGTEHVYFGMPTNFSQDLTPEHLVKARLMNMDKLSTMLTNKLKTTSVERYMPSLAEVEKHGAHAKWTKKLPFWCGSPVHCTVGTPGNVQEWNLSDACHKINA